jgi:hypothetical protein
MKTKWALRFNAKLSTNAFSEPGRWTTLLATLTIGRKLYIFCFMWETFFRVLSAICHGHHLRNNGPVSAHRLRSLFFPDTFGSESEESRHSTDSTVGLLLNFTHYWLLRCSCIRSELSGSDRRYRVNKKDIQFLPIFGPCIVLLFYKHTRKFYERDT